jgi:hypothetical protein
MPVDNEKSRLFGVAHGVSLPSDTDGRTLSWEYSITCTPNFRNGSLWVVAN